jgi:hypothetical protein
MKSLLLATLAVVIYSGCRTSRELNVEMVDAQLIKVDTVFQGSGNERQQLTWRDVDNIEYVSLVAMSGRYPVGMTMTVLRRR